MDAVIDTLINCALSLIAEVQDINRRSIAYTEIADVYVKYGQMLIPF